MKMKTLNTIWYLMLETFELLGKKLPTRAYVKQLVGKWAEEQGKTRAQLGIITGVRAELYFDGEWTSVSFDSIKELAKDGTDIIFIEKEGVPDVLGEYADKCGIAMVNTRGKLTEYGKELIDAAKIAGGHIAIMTDYDAAGVKIASESPRKIPWIGANDDMLRDLGLDRNEVKVSTTSDSLIPYITCLVENSSHPVGNYVKSGEYDDRFKDVDIEFLKEDRVELDSILARFDGKEEEFFDYIKDKLKELYPTRDYNRAIDIPSTIVIEDKQKIGAEHEEPLEIITERVGEITNKESELIEKELKDVEGFLVVEDKLKAIKERLVKVLNDDPNYKDFVEEFNELVESHPFFENQEDSS